MYYAVCNNLKDNEIEETTETKRNETCESTETAETTLISALQAQIDTLQQHNSLLSQQLAVKDNQIAMQADQIKQLADSLRDTTAALTAAQALHAGTIQQQLADKQASHEGQAEERKGFWQRIFKKRS